MTTYVQHGLWFQKDYVIILSILWKEYIAMWDYVNVCQQKDWKI